MNQLFEPNLKIEEQVSRIVLGIAIISVVLFNPSLPAWITLIACYPILTAILEYDPLNSCIHCVFAKIRNSRSNSVTHKSLSV